LNVFQLQGKSMELVHQTALETRISAVKIFGDLKIIVCDCEKVVVYKFLEQDNSLLMISRFSSVSDTTYDVKINSQVSVVAICGESSDVKLFDLNKNMEIGVMNAGSGNIVEALDFHPNGVYLACATEYCIRIFDVTTFLPIRVFNTDLTKDENLIPHHSNVLKFSSCGKFLYSGGIFVLQLDIKNSSVIKQYRSHTDVVTDLFQIGENKFNTSLVSVSSFDNCIKCWHNDKLMQSFKLPRKTDILGVDKRKHGMSLTVLIF